MKKHFQKLTNGVALILISLMHNQLAFSNDGFGKQFSEYFNSPYFQISKGMDELPAMVGKTNFEVFAAFWFFYFGLLLIPLGFLVHSMEKRMKFLPFSFTISYLFVVIIGSYMVPNSGMTFIMLPHAIFMLVVNYIKFKKTKDKNELVRG